MAETGRRILIVDDEPKIRLPVAAHLRAHGYAVGTASAGKEALKWAAQHNPELVLLDLGLPDMDGIDVLGRLRGWSDAPVIVISARTEERERVRALDSGADDYMTKPFGMEELLARTRANLRRVGPPQAGPDSGVLELGRLRIDTAAHKVTVDGSEVRLTPIEWGLLWELASSAGRVVEHRRLQERVWGGDYAIGTEGLRTYIKQLRKKLEPDPTRPRYIQNEPGVGYVLRTPREG